MKTLAISNPFDFTFDSRQGGRHSVTKNWLSYPCPLPYSIYLIDEIYITTKVEETDDSYQASQKYIQEIDLEYANLILIHRSPLTGVGIDLWEGLIKAKSPKTFFKKQFIP